MRIEKYLGYTILIKDIVRDWSETAVEYKVVGTDIKEECESHMAVKLAKIDIDNHIKNRL